MTDDELKREAVQAADSICRHAGIETVDADVEDILAALRRVRDAATAAERKRCADLLRKKGAGRVIDEWTEGFNCACNRLAAAIERQEGA